MGILKDLVKCFTLCKFRCFWKSRCMKCMESEGEMEYNEPKRKLERQKASESLNKRKRPAKEQTL